MFHTSAIPITVTGLSLRLYLMHANRKLRFTHLLALPMFKSIVVALALVQLLLSSAVALATPVYKCSANGTVRYQEGPCQPDSRKPPTIEELNAARQKQLGQEAQRPGSPKPQSGSSAKPEAAVVAPGKLLASAGTTFKCDSRKHCSQMTSCAEAKYFLANCPGVKMDGDRDGIPCEEQFCGH
ncbi:excalibur calcium-binding domain-containing protein [Undibacterium sp.]|uniref:excalibur calcium-binding domain-containing protein n=1 Tax=Undibacterium sp. TaxID=1914977 RepID=UPI0025D3B8C7|nr:excalibur calcium-binding domain-containing protein [Undibacterium sp.]